MNFVVCGILLIFYGMSYIMVYILFELAGSCPRRLYFLSLYFLGGELVCNFDWESPKDVFLTKILVPIVLTSGILLSV